MLSSFLSRRPVARWMTTESFRKTGKDLSPSRLRSLYRNLMRVHKDLPENLKLMGNTYVRSEFRTAINNGPTASAAQVEAFLDAWQDYADNMLGKVSNPGSGTFGEDLSALDIELTEEQKEQLEKIRLETERWNK